MSDLSPAPSAPAAPADQGGCPTPLAWQEVVERVRNEGTTHRVEVDGGECSATSIGHGPPIWFLPGFLGDHEQLALSAWLLQDDYCCVMVDPPTARVGKIESPDKSLARWAGSIVRLADELGHDRLCLHGPNLGGLIALRLAMVHSDRLRAVSLQCAFARLRLSVVESFLVALGCRSGRTVGQVRAAMRIQEENHRRWFAPFDPTRWGFFADNIAATPVAEAARRARIAARVDLRGQLPQMEVPSLVIQSEGDGRATSTAQAELAAGLPQVRVESLDNCGRLPHITHPHRLVKLLRNFWEQTS